MRFRLWPILIPLMMVLFAPWTYSQNVLAPGASGNVELAPSTSGQNLHVPLPADLRGQLNGVPYRIRVPANWNGTLLVYAYGYAEAFDPPPQAPMSPPSPDLDAQTLLQRGFALAGLRAAGAVDIPGGMAPAGWNIKERMQNTVVLTTAFRSLVGMPKRTIMWGKSMGGLVTLAMIEKYPGLFDGAVALCPGAAGKPRTDDQRIGITLAYAVAFGWEDAWGTPGNINPDLNVMTTVIPHALARSGPEYKVAWEFLRMVNRIPYDNSFYANSFRYQTLWLGFAPQPDLNRRAGGQVPQNLNTVYSLTDKDREFLAGEFSAINRDTLMAQVDDWLDRMNTSSRYMFDRNARNYAEHYYEPTGRITRPVITLHTTHDAAAIPNNESAYRAAVEAQGKGDLLMQEFTTGVPVVSPAVNTHCTFDPQQYFAAINAMVQWIDTGRRPDPADFFTKAGGFDPDYVPEPWPW